MSEIININVGKAGVRIGESFLDQIAHEHFPQNQQKRGRHSMFFQQKKKNNFARSLFIDMNQNSIDQVQLKSERYQINKDNLVKGTGLFSDLYVSGYFNQGASLAEKTMLIIRKQVEACDCLSGFVINNSLGGGTGGGLTSILLSKLRDNFCDKIVQQHMIAPIIDIYYQPIEIYNAVLGFHHTIQQSDLCFLNQNQAITQRLFVQKQIQPSIKDVNLVHAEYLTQTSSSYRFSGSLNTNQRKTATNLVVFPRMKFLMTSISNKKQRLNYLQNVFENQNFSIRNFFQSQTYRYSIYALQINCRDHFAFESEIDSKVKTWMKNIKIQFCEWLPNSLHISLIQPAKSMNNSSSMLTNSRNIVKTFQKWSELFTGQFRAKAFLHHYTQKGMDQMQFTEAQSNLNDLISEYIPCFYSEDDQFYDDQDQIPPITHQIEE